MAGDVTELLNAWSQGDEGALDRLLPQVDERLHWLARQYLRRERPGHTLQPTALIHEAFLRLIDWKTMEWQSRAHFFAVAAKMMRRILVTHALRRRLANGAALLVNLSEAEAVSQNHITDVLEMDRALDKLAEFDERKSRIVEVRYFGGLTEVETAEVMKVSVRTVQREWSLAKAWLFRELGGIRMEAHEGRG